MRRRDITTALFSSATTAAANLTFDANGNVLPTSALPGTANAAASLGQTINPRTAAEIAAAVMPVNFIYPPGHVFRHYTAAQITQTQAFSSTPTLDCSAAINNAIKCTTGDVFFPTGIHYINAPIYIPSTANANVRLIGESRTNTQIQPMANSIADANGLNALIINQAANEKFSMWRIRLTTGGIRGITYTGISVYAVGPTVWSSVVTYNVGEVVTRTGNTYAALKQTTNQDPVRNPAVWQLQPAGVSACQPIFSGSFEDCWFDTGSTNKGFFKGGFDNFRIDGCTLEFQKGCFILQGAGSAGDFFATDTALSNCHDYFLQKTDATQANIISIKGLHAYTHNRGVLLCLVNCVSLVVEDVILQASTGGANLGSIGVASLAGCTDFQISDVNVLSNAAIGTGPTATIFTFQNSSGQLSDTIIDGSDTGIQLTGTAPLRISLNHVDIVNTRTAALRVLTGSPSGVVTASHCNWSDGQLDLILFSTAGKFDLLMNHCRFLNAGLGGSAGARNLMINTTATVRISDSLIGQNNVSAAAGFFIEADGAGPGEFTLSDCKLVGKPSTGINTGPRTINFDGLTGTWTPSVGGTATYTTQQGIYTIKGKAVQFWGRLAINAIGTGSQTNINGLPFVNNPACYGAGVVPFFQNAATALTSLGLLVAPATSQISLHTLVAAAASTGTVNVMQNGTELIFSGSYQTA